VVDQQNNLVEVDIERLKDCGIRLTVTPSEKLKEEAYKQGIKSLKKDVDLPGFRKGKAPDELILKKYPDAIKEEADKKLASLAFIEAEKLVNIPILNNDSPISYDKTEDGKLVFNYETEPLVPKVDIKNFNLKPIQKKEISNEDIDDMIQQVRFFYATWKDVQDKPIKLNDYIIVDLEDLTKEPAELIFANTRLEVTEKNMAKWMLEAVVGKNLNDKIETESYPDETLSESEKKDFSTKRVRVTIKKIEEATLPELTDDFAKKVGAANMEELKKSIHKMLEQKMEDKELIEKRKQVNSFLLNNYATFDLPKSLMTSECKHRMDDILKNPASKKEFEEMPEDQKKKQETSIAKDACNALFLFYISKTIAREANIPITFKDAQDEAVAMLHSSGIDNPDKNSISDNVMALAFSRILLAKVQDYILAQTTK
jgi:trigger factor